MFEAGKGTRGAEGAVGSQAQAGAVVSANQTDPRCPSVCRDISCECQRGHSQVILPRSAEAGNQYGGECQQTNTVQAKGVSLSQCGPRTFSLPVVFPNSTGARRFAANDTSPHRCERAQRTSGTEANRPRNYHNARCYVMSKISKIIYILYSTSQKIKIIEYRKKIYQNK